MPYHSHETLQRDVEFALGDNVFLLDSRLVERDPNAEYGVTHVILIQTRDGDGEGDFTEYQIMDFDSDRLKVHPLGDEQAVTGLFNDIETAREKMKREATRLNDEAARVRNRNQSINACELFLNRVKGHTLEIAHEDSDAARKVRLSLLLRVKNQVDSLVEQAENACNPSANVV